MVDVIPHRLPSAESPFTHEYGIMKRKIIFALLGVARRHDLRGKNMKKQKANDIDMRKEYDFSGGIRGKHYKAYQAGHTVHITKEDGTTSVQYFTLKDGSVMLDPDVKPHFPDSDSVNRALRSIIAHH